MLRYLKPLNDPWLELGLVFTDLTCKNRGHLGSIGTSVVDVYGEKT